MTEFICILQAYHLIFCIFFALFLSHFCVYSPTVCIHVFDIFFLLPLIKTIFFLSRSPDDIYILSKTNWLPFQLTSYKVFVRYLLVLVRLLNYEYSMIVMTFWVSFMLMITWIHSCRYCFFSYEFD